ncbi:Metal homeostatis protein BSD2 [[Candida] zeylanoides]
MVGKTEGSSESLLRALESPELHTGTESDAESLHSLDSDVLFVNEDQRRESGGEFVESPAVGSSSHQVDLESQRPAAARPVRALSARQRLLNVLHRLLPVRQTYERINNGLTTGRMQANVPGNFVGHGTDGVFRNLMAKPDTESNRLEVETHPPSYDEAAADATPEYWESSVISPMYEDEVFVEGLPVGNLANFVWNALVSVAFQFVGFVLCYLLHTSHAAKQGSRAGLGITFVVYGYTMIPNNFGHADRIPDRFQPADPNYFGTDKNMSLGKDGGVDSYNSGLFQQNPDMLADIYENRTPYFAYGVIAFGIFMVIKAMVDFWRVKQIEHAILAPNSSPQETHTATEHSEHHNDSEDD